LFAGTRNLLSAFSLLALVFASAFILWPGIHGPFLFDDIPNLKNLSELNGHPTLRNIGVYVSLFPGSPGRPLSTISFLLNDSSWPSDPLGFKLTNLWIHLLNGVLVFGLARSLARNSIGQPPPAGANSDQVALACAALWLLSPIQVSAVFLTVQRMTELAATFAFAGLWGFFAMVPRARTIRHACTAVAILGLGTALSFLSKENGALVPLLALVTCATLLAPSMKALPTLPRRLVWTGIALPSAAVLAMLGKIALEAPTGHYASRSFGLWERLMTEARVLVDYTSLILMPRLSSSSLYNDDFVISRGLLDPATTLPAILLVLAALAAGLCLRRRKPFLAFGLLWYIGAHVMESSVVALEIYFEHRNYIPLFGPAFAMSAVVFRTTGNLRRPALIGLGAWLLLAAGITYLQARAWGSEERLAAYWHVEHPHSLRAQQQYASYLLGHDRQEEARAIMASAAQRQVSPLETALQVLTLDCDAGRSIEAARIQEVLSLLDTSPETPGTAAILARLRLSVQRGNCPQAIFPEAWLRLTEHAMRNPNGAGIVRMLRVERAELFLAAHQLDPAIAELSQAYGSGPRREARVAFYAAALLATAGRYDEARTWAKRPMDHHWNWKDWVAQTDRQAQDLVDAIDQAQDAGSRPDGKDKPGHD
jgi:tetratricopeptide (TPR) repeat protein